MLFDYLNFCIFAMASVCFAALYFKCRPEKAFLPMLLFNSMLFYLLASFHLTKIGFPVLYAANLALYIPAAKKFLKLSPQERTERLFTPGFFILLIYMTILFLYLHPRQLCGWDTISHWGKVVKLFIQEGKLGCEYPSHIVGHCSYPPGTCMVSTLIHSCFSRSVFYEGVTIFSHELLNLSAFMWIFSSLRWKNRYLLQLCALLPLIMLDKVGSAYDFAYTDLILAMVMATAFYQLLNFRRWEKIDIFIQAVLLGSLPMIRNAGWQYCISLLVLLAIFLIKEYKIFFFEKETGKLSAQRVALVAGCFILPLLLHFSWKFQLKYYNTAKIFTGEKINFPLICSMFNGFSAPGWSILARYLGNIATDLILQIVFAVALLIFVFKQKNEDLKRAFRCTVIFFAVATVLFHISMFTFYLFEFEANFPSQIRYLFNFMIIPGFVTALLFADYFAGISQASEPEEKKHLFRIASLALVSCIFLYTIIGLTRYLDLNGHAVAGLRNECRQISRFNHIIMQKNNTFCLLSNRGVGFMDFAMSFEYPHNFFPIHCYNPVFSGKYKLAPGNNATEISPEKLMETWSKCTHVYIDRVSIDFHKDFRSVFVDSFTPDISNINSQLFRVTPTLQLEPVF